MKHIKLFDSYKDDRSIILDFWKVDPDELQRIISDSLEHADMWFEFVTTFTVLYPYPNSYCENNSIYYLSYDGVIDRGAWCSNFDFYKGQKNQKDYDKGEAAVPFIEIIVDTQVKISTIKEDFIKFKNYLHGIFLERDIPYVCGEIEYLSHSYLINFIYTGEL